MSSAGQIASIICKNFAQNAWKKDLCSNCFKSEVEHQDSLINGGSGSAPVTSQQDFNSNDDIKWKTSQTHPNLLSQTNGNSNESSIKTFSISLSQTNGNKSNKSVNDCQNTTTVILQSNKKSVNPSPQILMNTKRIPSTQVLNGNGLDSCAKLCDKQTKDSIKDNNFNNNSINNCFELRKVINSKQSNSSEQNNELGSINSSTGNKAVNNSATKDPKLHNFPQMSSTKDRLHSNLKNNNSYLNNISNNNNKCFNETTPQSLNNSTGKKTTSTTVNTNSTVTNKTMPLIGILKSESNRHLIKYRSKNKCLVFKEGDPMIIGIDRSNDDYPSDEYSDDEDDQESDDFDDDEQIYYSDDKELRELTRVNTKFNSNFANFSINTLNESKLKDSETKAVVKDSVPVLVCKIEAIVSNGSNGTDSHQNDINCVEQKSVVITETNDCVTEEVIPEICAKLVENSLIETFEEIIDTNRGINCESIKSHSPDSGNSDILPMSTSSDSYSSSSSDEKEDSINSEPPVKDIENFKTHLIITQNVKPILESKHLRQDSESDNSSTNSDSGLELQDYKRRQELVKPQNRGTKPQLPVKPNISTITMNSVTISVENKSKTVQISVPESEPKITEVEEQPLEEMDEEEENHSISPLIADELYEEIFESCDGMNGTEGKFSMNIESNNNYVSNEKPMDLELKTVIEAKRDIKLAELAHELEQVRHMKRPAPQPPVPKDITTEMDSKEVVIQESKPVVYKQPTVTTYNITDKKVLPNSSAANQSANTSLPIKPHRFSIRKLLHKKSSSDKILSVKIRDHSNESQHSVNSNDYPGADRKAWKQSEFDRTNLKIVHPIDLTKIEDKKTVSLESETSQPIPEQRPEAPPRTPKPNRPSVPARRRKQSGNQQLLQPRGEPPPPPTTPPPYLSSRSSSPALKSLTAETSVKTNDLNEAYNQLAKSNFSNLLAIKSKIESIYEQNDYKWCDFEVTNAVQLGTTLLYKDCMETKTRKSVNLLVLSDCYCAPLVTRFRHHSDLVLVLDDNWTKYELLSELSIDFEPKLMNSVILQLYLILERLEKTDCNQLPNDIIDKIIICSSKEDCLLILPINRLEAEPPTTRLTLTLHQFLAHVLEKLLPNSLFGSLDSQVLSRPSVPISHSMTIVKMIVFKIPVQQMNDNESINYWFDINRSKFINQFCCLSVDTTKLLTHLDYNYLCFLCNHSLDLIRNAIALLVNTTNDTKNCSRLF